MGILETTTRENVITPQSLQSQRRILSFESIGRETTFTKMPRQSESAYVRLNVNRNTDIMYKDSPLVLTKPQNKEKGIWMKEKTRNRLNGSMKDQAILPKRNKNCI